MCRFLSTKHLIANDENLPYYVRPVVNLTLLSINEMGTMREKYGISDSITTGVYVQNSLEGSIGAQSIITEINNVKVNSTAEFNVELLKYSVGETVILTLINKDGLNTRQVAVTLRS